MWKVSESGDDSIFVDGNMIPKNMQSINRYDAFLSYP